MADPSEARSRRRTIVAGVAVAGLIVVGAAVALLRAPTPGAGDRGPEPTTTALPAGATYGELLDALPLAAGAGDTPVLLLGDVPLAARAGGTDLPPPGAEAWLFDGIVAVQRHTLFPSTPDFVGAAQRLQDRPFAQALGFTPADVDQWADWQGGATAVMSLRGGTGALTRFLDASGDWARQATSPRWYRGAADPSTALRRVLAGRDPSQLALVVRDGQVQAGPAPGGAGDTAAVPLALAPASRRSVGDLAGMDRLAERLQGWATIAFVIPAPHQRFHFGDVDVAGRRLAPYRHLALAGVTDDGGERTVLVLVHADASAARTNAARLPGNLDAAGRDDAVVRRDGEVVVVEGFADEAAAAVRAAIGLDPGALGPVVPATGAGPG